MTTEELIAELDRLREVHAGKRRDAERLAKEAADARVISSLLEAQVIDAWTNERDVRSELRVLLHKYLDQR